MSKGLWLPHLLWRKERC